MGLFFKSKEEKLRDYRALEKALKARLEEIQKEMNGGIKGELRIRNQALRDRTNRELGKVRKKIERLEARIKI